MYPGIGITPFLGKSRAESNPYFSAYQTRVYNLGGTITPQESAALLMFYGSIDPTEHERIFPMFMTDPIAAGVSLVNPNSDVLAFANSPTHTPGEGYNGNGLNSYVTTQFNPFTDSSVLTQNSASLYVYSRTNSLEAVFDIGVQDADHKLRNANRYTGDVALYTVNESTGIGVNSVANNNSLGLLMSNRTAADNVEFWRNGVEIGDETTASSGIPNGDIYVCSLNLEGIATTFSTRQYSLAGVGKSIASPASFYAAVQQLGDDLGWSV